MSRIRCEMWDYFLAGEGWSTAVEARPPVELAGARKHNVEYDLQYVWG
jgi:hypothetical protein